MDYLKIHDNLLSRAKHRKYNPKLHHNHHIFPKHESQQESDLVVPLTIKEHYIVHLMRYKLGHGMGNYKAYLLLKYGINDTNIVRVHAKLGAKAYHEKFSKTNRTEYINNQSKSGKIGGQKCYSQNLGFFGMSEIDKKTSRDKGRETLVDKKIGMFSDEYRLCHAISLQKKVYVDGVVYSSMTEASKKYSVSAGTVTYRVNSNKEKWKNWYYIKESNDE